MSDTFAYQSHRKILVYTLCVSTSLKSKKVLVKVKEQDVMNVESRPFPQELGANQDTNELNEDTSCMRQGDPSFLGGQPDQKRKI